MSAPANKLHNNHNVYILGAGFSRLRGLPLMNDFMLQMRDALDYHGQLGHEKECRAIEAVLSFRLNASSAAYRVQVDLENIEELFSLASASPSPMEESIKLAIAATLDFSTRTSKIPRTSFQAPRTSLSIKNNWNWTEATHYSQPTGTWVAPTYEYIVRALLGHWNQVEESVENSFITFNYDTLLEDALEGLGVSFSTGFGESASGASNTKTNVYKLHGSVNWATPKGARTRIEVFKDYRAVINAGLVPQIIPPTWKKDSRGAFDEIWTRSLKALADATRVVIIGFSIPPTDLHFKYLLAAGLQENYSLREIVFVNPSDGMPLIEERCLNLFANQVHNAAKLRLVPSTAEAFCGQGLFKGNVSSIARPICSEVQGLQTSFHAA